MSAYQQIISHLKIARESGSITKATAPGDGDAAWVTVGTTEDLTPTPAAEVREHWGPKTWGSSEIVRLDAMETQRATDFSANISEGSKVLWELLFGTAAITGSGGSYTPNASRSIKGWAWIKQTDHAGNAINSLKIWGLLTVSATKFPKSDAVTYEIQFKEIYSAATAGTLSNLS